MRNLFKTLAALVAAAVAMTACQTAPVETVETNRLIKVVEFTAEDIETRTSFTEPEGNSYRSSGARMTRLSFSRTTRPSGRRRRSTVRTTAVRRSSTQHSRSRRLPPISFSW